MTSNGFALHKCVNKVDKGHFVPPPTVCMDHQRPETEPSCAALSETFPAAPLIGLNWRQQPEMEITRMTTQRERGLTGPYL